MSKQKNTSLIQQKVSTVFKKQTSHILIPVPSCSRESQLSYPDLEHHAYLLHYRALPETSAVATRLPSGLRVQPTPR